MLTGYWGKILRVDLTSGKTWVEQKDDAFYRTYLGGRGLISYYLLKEVPPGCDPLGPENILVFAPSILTGTSIPGCARNSIGAKSPLTGGYGEGEAGGSWGVNLRWAGYDGLVVSGCSQKPVYIWVDNDGVAIKDATTLWGMEPYECREAIRSENGDAKAEAAMIGPGGENLIRFACIAQGTHNYVGRSGLGAVMGSKKLKAAVVRGHSRPPVADKEKIKSLAGWMRDNYQASLGTMTEMGTARGVPVVNAAGGFPTRNFQEGSFEGHERLSGRYMTDTILVERSTCYACPVRCKRVVEVTDESLQVSRKYGGPEYESIAGFGSNCCIDDIKVVAKANEICDRYTIDTITTAAMISGAMECAEKGLLPKDLIEGIDLRFGSADGMLALLDLITQQKGLGAILSKGPKEAIQQLGENTTECFVHVKGQPLPFQEPRWKTGMGIGYALSPTGAEHMANIHDVLYSDLDSPAFAEARTMGILKATDTLELSRDKARLWAYMGISRSVHNVVCLCSFMPFGFNQIVEMIQAVTGWNISNWELMKVSERCLNMARWFNAREGFTPSEDDLPARCFQPIKSGTLSGQAIDPNEFHKTVELTYDMLGWEKKTGAAGIGKLCELGLDWLLVEDSNEKWVANG